MSNLKRWKTGTTLLLMFGLTSGTVAPIVAPMLAPAPAVAQGAGFSDVSSSYWAQGFIQALSSKGIIAGYPDGTFKPENPVTRSEFAAMVGKAFSKGKVRDAVKFVDVPSSYWANSAIQNAYQIGFLSGYPGNVFRPVQNIPREQVLVSLANGLNYSASNPVATDLQFYSDGSSISDYARSSIAAASEKSIVVDYPNVNTLSPGRNATRAEVAAFIYQALVSSGNAAAINSPYIVALNGNTPAPTVSRLAIPAGTTIPVKYSNNTILITPTEKQPLTVTVASDVSSSNGTVLIPAGSKISGQLQPAPGGGTQFVAQQLTLTNGQQLSINAASQPVTKTVQVSQGLSLTNILKDAALGSAAAAGIAAISGNRHITDGKVLIGTGVGGILGGLLDKKSVSLISVNTNSDLNPTLSQDLVFQQ